jgi:hypothetical protein
MWFIDSGSILGAGRNYGQVTGVLSCLIPRTSGCGQKSAHICTQLNIFLARKSHFHSHKRYIRNIIRLRQNFIGAMVYIWFES